MTYPARFVPLVDLLPRGPVLDDVIQCVFITVHARLQESEVLILAELGIRAAVVTHAAHPTHC